MKAIRLSRSLVVAIALVVSLGANVALFVGGVLYDVVDQFVDGAFGLATAAATQRRALTALRTTNRKLGGTLAASRAFAASQSQELADLRTTSGKAAKRSRDRLAKSIGRNILTAPGKALPYAGIAIVSGLTVWEIKDLCATIRNMDEIQKAAGMPEAEDESELIDYCARPDLAVKHAVETWKSYPRKEWREYKKYVPDLPGWEDIPDSWREDWRSTVPDNFFGGVSDILDRLKRVFP